MSKEERTRLIREVAILDPALAERFSRHLARTEPAPKPAPPVSVWNRVRPTNASIDYHQDYMGAMMSNGDELQFAGRGPSYVKVDLTLLVDMDDMEAFRSWLHEHWSGFPR